ncbi:MAG: hypothetical protein Kow0074_09040 [Candidatus Zixiibacteriota bacterium]
MVKNHVRTLTMFASTVVMTAFPAIARAETEAESGGLFSGGALVELALLLAAAACALTAFKVYNSVRGGRIAQGWQWFTTGFLVLGLAQLGGFGSEAGLLLISDFWIGLLRLGSILLIFVGAIRMRRLLA